MFKQVYTHSVCQSIDFMVADALYEANPFFKFTEAIHKPDRYMMMTDNVLPFIEYSDDPRLKKSK